MRRFARVGLLGVALLGCEAPSPDEGPAPAVARAGELILTREEVELRVDALRTFGTDLGRAELRRRAADEVLLRKLMAREARRQGLDKSPHVAASLRRLDEAVAMDLYSLHLAGADTIPDAELDAGLAPIRARVDADQLEFRTRQLRELYRLQLGTERRASQVEQLEAELELWVDPVFLDTAVAEPLQVVARAGQAELLASDLERFLPTGPAALRIPVDRRREVIRSAVAVRVLARRQIAKGVLNGPFAKRHEADVEALLARSLTDHELTRSLAQGPLALEAYYREHPKEFSHPEEVHVRHLLVVYADSATPHAGRSRADAEALATELLGRLRAGQSFDALCAQYSDLPDRSWDLGYFSEGSGIEPKIEEASFRTARGDFAGPVETRHGFHLLQVLDRRIPGVRPFADVKESLAAKLEAERKREVVAELEQRVRGSLRLELDPSYFGP